MIDQQETFQLISGDYAGLWVTMLLGLGLLVAVLVVLRRPVIGIAGFAFLNFALVPNIFIYKPAFITTNIAILALTLFGLVVSLRRLGGRGVSVQPFKTPAFALTIVLAIWIVVSIVNHGGVWRDIYPFINNLLIMSLVMALVETEDDFRTFVWFAFWGTVLVTLAAFLFFLRHPVLTYPIRPPEAFYGNRVVMSLSSVIGFFLGLGLLRSTKNLWAKASYLGGCAITGAMALSGASRGVTVALLAIGGVYFVLALKPRFLTIPAFVLFAIVVTALNSEELVRFYNNATHTAVNVYSAAELSSGRIYLYRAALRMFPTAPMWGVGWEQFQNLWFSFFPAPLLSNTGIPKLNTHSSYLQVLVELGVMGFLVFAAWTYAYLRAGGQGLHTLAQCTTDAARNMRALLWGVQLAVVALLLHSLFDNEGRGKNKIHLLLVALILAAGPISARLRGQSGDEEQPEPAVAPAAAPVVPTSSPGTD